MQQYSGAPKQLAFLTQHKKEHLVKDALAKLSIELVHTDAYNTDSLGTFDNRIKRTSSAISTALQKARMACELTGLNAGLGSEGSFNSQFGLGIVDQEIIAYVDIAKEIEIVARASQALTLSLFSAENEAALLQNLRGFSSQQAWHFMSSLDEQGTPIKTGVVGEGALIKAAQELGYPVMLSPDFRAMHCPERMDVIKQAANDLIERLCALCPSCSKPDFVFTQKVPGLPCEICATPSSQTKAIRAVCKYCHSSQSQASVSEHASAFYCVVCNP